MMRERTLKATRLFTAIALVLGAFVAGALPAMAAPLPVVSIGSLAAIEGNSGTGSARFSVTLSQIAGTNVTVHYATTAGTAIAPDDYTPVSGTATIVAGTTTATIDVPIVGDTIEEANETFVVQLSTPTGATIGTASATGTILDDDPSTGLTVAIGNASAIEGNADARQISLAVTLSDVSASDVSVDYATTPITATAGSDFTATSGTLTIPAGSITGFVPVDINGDITQEATETFSVTLTNAVGATLGRAVGNATITNDDLFPSQMFTWGTNATGALGAPTVTPGWLTAPKQVGTATTWKSVATSAYAEYPDFAAIRTDGTLWSWGDNSYGQVGDGTTTARPAPVRIGTATNWMTVVKGGDHNVALKTDGSLWTWGSNSDGQLGNNSTANRTSPTHIGTSTWIAIAAGYAHTVAIRSDGSLWAWGSNGVGQVGDNSTADRLVPTRIGTGVTWSSVTAGFDFTLAIQTDHTLWSWGGNVFGQLGDGTNAEHHVPTKVGLATTWAFASAGLGHVLATRTDGSLWAWGDNRSAALGDGTTTD
ncbi:MAG: hypothetical protein QOI44_972, partial [Actinomycetota bacterium]|nr:hypothetical protein [Actinomycetota bacterium]